jgi:hypothetical protein
MPFLMHLYRDLPPTKDVQLTVMKVGLLPYIVVILYILSAILREFP